MRLTLKTEENSVVLHAADSRNVDYTSYVATKPGRISPCDDLKGRTVRVVTADAPHPDEIEQLDIMK